MITIIKAGLLILFRRFDTVRALARTIVTLVGGVPISAYHLSLAIDAALNARVSPERWKTFTAARLCAAKDETLRSLGYHVVCGLLVGAQAFAEYLFTHWAQTAVLAITLYLLRFEVHRMRRRWRHVKLMMRRKPKR